MASKGRGSAKNGLNHLFLALIFLLLGTCHFAEAGKVYLVGDTSGWSLKSVAWANGKVYREGDILDFRYNSRLHSVVVVSSFDSFKNCKTPKGHSKVYNSGKDCIKLRKGNNYFFCGAPGHCKAGMKMVVRAK